MINIKNLGKEFAGRRVLDDISCQVGKGEVVALIGPSGGGKSTLLRCIQGLETKDGGKISIEAAPTKITMVFQNFNLFPHMTVLQNLTYAPIKVLKQNASASQAKAMQLLERVGMAAAANQYPRSLSGGQKQRVAIARALALDPEVLLFDEPTSALDPENVQEVLTVIKNLAHTGITMLIVTHEMRFARDVADRIWFLENGKLLEDSYAVDFFTKPSTARAREFLREV